MAKSIFYEDKQEYIHCSLIGVLIQTQSAVHKLVSDFHICSRFRTFHRWQKSRNHCSSKRYCIHCTQPCRLAPKPAESATISAGLDKLSGSSHSMPTGWSYHSYEERDTPASTPVNVAGLEACLLSHSVGLC